MFCNLMNTDLEPRSKHYPKIDEAIFLGVAELGFDVSEQGKVLEEDGLYSSFCQRCDRNWQSRGGYWVGRRTASGK